jgi:hypothetical protein
MMVFLSTPAEPAAGVEYLSDELACVKLAGRFMRDVVEGKIVGAFDRVRPYFPIPQQEFEELASRTESQLRGSERDFGRMLGYKFVREERVKDFLIRFTFIIKHELTVTRWRFLYYKPEDGWLLNSLYWDDQVENLFDGGSGSN